MTGTRVARNGRMLAILLVMFALWGGLPGVALGDETAILSLGELPESVVAGDELTVSVDLEGVEALYGLDVRLMFDAQVLQVVDAATDVEGVQVEVGDLLSPDFVVTNDASNAEGTIWLALTQLNPREPVTGSGTAMTISFKAIADGAPGLQVVGATLASRDGDKQPVRLAEGVAQAAMPTNVPAPTAEPTQAPTDAPTLAPTVEPTSVPTTAPTLAPTTVPTAAPTTIPEAEQESNGLTRVLVMIGAGILVALGVRMMTKRDR